MVDKNTLFGGMLTTLGAAKKTNCDALGMPWEPSHMLIGDANGTDPVPDPSQTKLINQVHRAQLNQLRVSPTDSNVLIAEVVLPPEVGGWWMRELALEDKDGVFSAVANLAPSYKPLLAQGSGRNQVVRMHIITNGTANIQLKIDPSVVLATRDYVDRSVNAGTAFTSVSSSRTLKPTEMGFVLIDASAGALNIQLPSADATVGRRNVIVHRKDNSIHRLVIKAKGKDKLKFHTHLNPAGYPFLVLMGAGDWWHLRSDGAGSWWPIGRFDSTTLGRPVFETTTVFSPGGYGAMNGQLLQRDEWPWLWDHAQQSGMLYPEKYSYMEGAWTFGDYKSTFRIPEARGEFFRVLDEDRRVDKSTLKGVTKSGSPVITHLNGRGRVKIGMTLEGGDFPSGTTVISVGEGEITASNASQTDGAGEWRIVGRIAGSWTPDNLERHTHPVSFGSGTGDRVALLSAPSSLAGGNARLDHVEARNTSPPFIGRVGDEETRPRNIAYPGRMKII
ncbi:phage tail protein [Pseudomonas sp. B21-040]|uniref:phage tail-collar fiber domain-containing protein n=1 Tax=Pseudomonas sp. B21-040 TaxID=2895486 RepID=UPI00215FA673|nr:phage tail protein [Pseudomonas sp. B21-040]UVL42384.1 phage tail protein [Pseudomonas sp. B21-040]